VARQIKNQKIAIVEDDPAVCETLDVYFSAHNKVRTFASAEEAMAAEAGFQDIDVFIIDYKLPEKNGIELFQHLRVHFPDAKYILITGEMNYDLAESTRQVGFDALILKPFDITILDDNISGLIATTA
jgi:two-component system response regulator GlrR